MRSLDQLSMMKGQFGRAAAARTAQLLESLRRSRLRNPADLIRLHEIVLFLRAYPQSRTCRGEAEGRFTTNNRRFHEKYNISLQISRSGDGFAGVWQQEREFKGLDSPNNANENYTMRIDAAFRLRLDGNRLTGISESVHRQDSSGSKQDYNAVAFTGTPVSPNSLAVEIVWERDAQGRAMNGATCTLEKRQ
jgi:hypothetical protein